MRLLYFLFVYFRKLFYLYAPKVNRWYWTLSEQTRHRVGWAALFVSVCLCGVLIWGVCMMGIQVHYWIKGDESTQQIAISQDNAETTEDVALLDSYSNNNRHRQFKCGAMNPKRNVLLYRAFKDLNEAQLKAAKRLGIKPLSKRDDLSKYEGKLIKLKETKYYHIDPMTHSVPYLVPDAADFLSALGERWQQYHGTKSRFIITSCLRTDQDVKKLQRGNVNATKESCHRYGTTFDITYVRFDRKGKVRDHKLKADLARALYDMREAGHCYVKYEYRQSCFHITVRPK